MKKLLLAVLCVLPILASAQTNRVSVMPGDFLNPFIWSPSGIPASGDSLTINHAVVMNSDIYYTSGQILINAGGSFLEDATPRSMWIDGGSLVNHGTYTSHLVWVSSGGYIDNTANFVGIDSMIAQAPFTNSGTAGINDFWVPVGGTVNNSGTMNNTDSMLVQGTFVNTGFANIYDLAFDEMATFTNSFQLNVTNNMHNQGHIYNSYTMEVANDFSNCNTQNVEGVVENDGIFCVGNDFLNCDQDSILGTGDYFVGGLSSNLQGVFDGTFSFNTPSGSLTLNTGTVGPGVSFGNGACSSGLNEQQASLSLSPNPTRGMVKISVDAVDFAVYDLSGQQVLNGEVENYSIDFSSLNAGVYLLKVIGARVQRVVKQ